MNEPEIEIERWARRRDEDLRADDAALSASLEIQARRRGRRRALGILVLALAIGGAFAVGRVTAPRTEAPESATSAPLLPTERPLRADDLEREALNAPLAERGELMLRAGDRWLEEGEVLASLRCYDELLRRPDGAEDDPTGASWLLYALRRDRN